MRMTLSRPYLLLILCAALLPLTLTCDGDDSTTPGFPPYDPTRPSITSFEIQRGGTAPDNAIVYGGEDIALSVVASSNAFPASCGLSEDDVVSGNLVYMFTAIPPETIPAPGLVTQATPQTPMAVWRVPKLDQYDSGDGLLYALQVRVFDECLGNESISTITVRAFANQGPPAIIESTVMSAVDTSSPVIEVLDQNGYFEVERGDACSISIEALSRTLPQICDNRDVESGEELFYEWVTSYDAINLSYGQDPFNATEVNFDIPVLIVEGDTFQVTCMVTDECTGTFTNVDFRFIVVGAPRITELSGTADLLPLYYDPYFDTYEVLPGNEVIVTAVGEIMDENLCEMKGITPDFLWQWQEITGSLPVIDPEYNPFPIPNHESTIEFVVPSAVNGTEYRFDVNVTDMCNGLSDADYANFLVIVKPHAVLTHVLVNTYGIEPSTESGRYEVYPGNNIRIRITGAARSDTTFCADRGIESDPPLRYTWNEPFDEYVTFNYDAIPAEEYCDLEFIVPPSAPPMELNLRCRVLDLCNGLETEVVVPVEIMDD